MIDEHPEPLDRVAELIARSSLEAGALGERGRDIAPERVAQVRERANRLEAAGKPPDEDNVRILYRRFGDGVAPGETFAARLNQLFGTVYPRGGRPRHDGEVAIALTASGFPISRWYIAQLRSGQRTDPSPETMRALARYFMVEPDYFWDRAYAAAIDADIALLTRVREDEATGSLDARAAAPQRYRPNRKSTARPRRHSGPLTGLFRRIRVIR